MWSARDRAYVPEPAEIARICAEIRAGWSEEQHWQRAGMVRQLWRAPVVRVGLDRAIVEAAESE